MTQNATSRGLLLRLLIVGFGALFLSFLLDPPHGPENWSSDWVTSHFSETADGQNPDIVLVYISEATLADKPYLSPIDREVLAKLVGTIDKAGAEVIGLDLILDRHSETAKDKQLIYTIKHATAKIVLGVIDPPEDLEQLQFQSKTLGELGLTPKCKRVTADSRVTCGHIYFGDHPSNLVLSGYVVRFIEDNIADTPFLSFGNAVAAAKSGKSYPAQSWTISWLLPPPPPDRSENFTTLDARSLLLATPFARDLLKGKIVLIGGNFKDRDSHFIPLSIIDHRRYPGLFIHAQFIAQILGDRHISDSPVFITGPILILIAAAACYLGWKSPYPHLLLELGGIVVLCIVAFLAFTLAHFSFPLAYATVFWLVSAAVGHYGIREKVGA